ncbi:gephyrin-like molybdotransferase Glp [Microbacterium indicum]|uniref:molybdopterin molybdotransferase MoeA n=1 Tax=Microbacterium indicum TaxID=358100 RepID=UPI0004200162|nr:gephyrin-like molybdotransferase Glp [Microbacterium indicum]
MITVEEHLGRVLAAARPLPPETVPVETATGRTLAAPAFSRLDVPAFANSAMDGFAVRFDDLSSIPATLRVVADVPAGSAEDPRLGPGECARIMTGAPLPSDADAVVPFEQTAGGLDDSLETAVVVARPAARGANVRGRAEDVAAGDEALPAGILVGPRQVAALISTGVAEVAVARRPRVAVVSTGAELVAPGVDPGPGRIPDSNGALLAGLVAEAGAEVVARGRVGDDPAELTSLLAGLDADVVVTSGGVSAGAFEPVKLALAGRVAFEKVAMQPGKPQAFGVLDGALFFGLPGNPVSVAVSFEVFVRPALLAMQRRREIARPLLRLPAAVGWRTPPGRRQHIPIAVNRADPGCWTVGPATTGGSGSHLPAGLGLAEGYAVVPAEVDAVAAGDLVDVMLIP